MPRSFASGTGGGPVSLQVGVTPTNATQGSVFFAGVGGVLQQDNANFYWNDSSNALLAGDTSTVVPFARVGLVGRNGGTETALLGLESYTNIPQIAAYAASGTKTSPTASTAFSTLFWVTTRGYGTSAFSGADRTRFAFRALENWTNSAQGTYTSLELTPLGGTTRGEYFRFTSTSLALASATQFAWANAATLPAAAVPTLDTGFARQSAGVIRATDGSTAVRGLIGGGAAVASAAALPLPTGRVFHVTGTTNITSITSTNFASGVCITLIFDDVLTFTDGNNLKLAGNFITTANDTITLVYDGTNWFETSRSINS